MFQKTIIAKHLATQSPAELAQKWQQFQAIFHNSDKQANIRASKEEQYQEGFLRELFVEIFGYTLNPSPNYNLITEQKNQTDSKKADGAILHQGNVIAVIELKSTKTIDLNSIVAQAFGYKNNQPQCRYVIISNFQKIRFYIQNSTEFLEFDLFTLSENQFQLMYLLLNQKNLTSGLPEKIKAESQSNEETITRQLYADYSAFKQALFNDLRTQNPYHNPLTLFQQSQKLLDRFLFIFFAEDCGLLPPNSILQIIQDWQKLKELDAYVPLYQRIKQYFGYLDTGNEKQNIYAYNGGLFKPDPDLDNLTISDEVLEFHTQKIADYDFNSEIDVNILGHIFENSLNQIEEIHAQLKGETANKKQSKRKKDGVYYTPKYITHYIVENTLGTLCQEKLAQLGLNESYLSSFELPKKGMKKDKLAKLTALAQEPIQKLESYRNWLLNLTICDPACGSGAFLNEALNFLIAEHARLDQMQSLFYGDTMIYPDIEHAILERNLYGVDINPESVEIAKLSLWLRTAQGRRKLNNLNNNIKCGNSLISDPKIAGETAFDFQAAFPKVFEQGGFDVIIGNPPYVNAKGENFNQAQKDFYYQNYQTAIYQIDTYILFIERLQHLMKPNAQAAYIVPNAWLNNLLLENVRRFVLDNFQLQEIVNTPSGVFTDATVDTVIFSVCKNQIRNQDVRISQANGTEIVFKRNTNQTVFSGSLNAIIDLFGNDHTRQILAKIECNTQALGEICDMASGIKEYQIGKGKPKQTETDKETNRFNATYKKDETYLRHLTGSDISRYNISWQTEYLSYGEWLAEPRQKKYFDGERLIIREIPSKTGLVVAFTDEEYTVKNSAHIAKKYSEQFDLKYILTILNSRLMGFYFKYKFAEFDDVFPKAKIGQCKLLPIIQIELNQQKPLINLADRMINLTQALHKKAQAFIALLNRRFSSLKISSKLQTWYELDDKAFFTELKKSKIILSPKDEIEFAEAFEAQKTEATALAEQIAATEREIDQRVFELYGLTNEEIAMITSSL